MTRTICADASGALTALVALLRSLHSSPEVRLEAARALRLLATKADETDGESVAAVARALGLDASKYGSNELGDFTERCVLEECERLMNENGERAAAGVVLACVNDEPTGGATSDPTADVGQVANADLIVSAARPSIDGSIDEAALSGSLPVRVARACFEALLSKQRRQVSQVPQMSFPSNLRQLRGQTVSMPAFFHFGSSFIL